MNDLKFTTTHEWVRAGNDMATVGITDHAQQLLGDMVFVELPAVGDVFSVGDELGVVESVKAASDFYAPVSGVVTSVNEAVIKNPGIVNNDPYDAGWLVELKPSNLNEELTNLLNADEYQNEIAEDH